MRTVTEIRKWLQAPHWTWWVAKWTYVVSVCVVWALLHLLLPGMTFGRFLLAGFLSPPVAVGTWYVSRFVEGMIRRIRQTVEAGIPLSPVRMVTDLVSERKRFVEHEELWATFCRGQKIAWDGQAPKLHRMQQTATGDVRARVNPAGLGGDLDAITRLAANGTMAGVMRCQEVSVQPSGGKAWLTFYKTPPLQRAFTIADLPASGRGRVTFGFSEEGGAASFRDGLSVLAVSTTGGGKSTLFKNAFIDMRRDDKSIDMFFVNPKRMEFVAFKSMVGQRIGNIRVAGYCETAAEAEQMFARFAEDMHIRQERLATMGMVELKHPTPDFPARIVVVDEMADIRATFDKLDKPLPIIISQGRATQDSVFSLAQVAKIETLGTVRDLYALRAGLRMMTPENTKAALGISENDGAPCSRIPLNMPGMGYYVTDDGTVGKFRTAPVSDKEWANVLGGGLPEGMPINVEVSGPPCFGYIAPERGSKVCGYVGIAGGDGLERHPVARRRAQHLRYDRVWCAEHERVENPWLVHIDHTRLQVVKFPSRAAALIWEERTIKELKPRWNVQHNSGNPLSNLNMTRRASVGWRVRDAASEYRQWGREHRVARRAVLAAAHQERVARLQEERERFVQTVTERAA